MSDKGASARTDEDRTNDALTTSLRVFLGHTRPPALAKALGRCENLKRLLDHADREGLSGILRHTWPKEAPPPALDQRRLEIFAHNGRVLETLRALGAALQRAGLEVIVIKGAALLTGPYRHLLGCRPLSDIDLVIRERRLADLRSLLARLGFRPYGARWRADGLEIDLHTHLDRSALLGHRHAAFRFPTETVWRHTLASPVGGPAVRLLEPALQATYLATHAVKHAFGRWLWLADLGLVLPSVPPARLERVLRHARAERAWTYTCELMRELGVLDPTHHLRPHQLSTVERTWLRLVAGREIGLGRVIAGLSIPNLGERLAYWREVALPGRETLERAAPDTRTPRRQWLVRSLHPRAAQAFRLAFDALRATGPRSEWTLSQAGRARNP